jgi:hypothetical protein
MSKLSKHGKFKVQVKTLDSLGIKPTFIKMHLEGGEMAASTAYREILKSVRNLHAICYLEGEGPLLEIMNSSNPKQVLKSSNSWII